jgi:hypothetical protein
VLFGEISPAKLLATKQTEAKDSNVSKADGHEVLLYGSEKIICLLKVVSAA